MITNQFHFISFIKCSLLCKVMHDLSSLHSWRLAHDQAHDSYRLVARLTRVCALFTPHWCILRIALVFSAAGGIGRLSPHLAEKQGRPCSVFLQLRTVLRKRLRYGTSASGERFWNAAWSVSRAKKLYISLALCFSSISEIQSNVMLRSSCLCLVLYSLWWCCGELVFKQFTFHYLEFSWD